MKTKEPRGEKKKKDSKKNKEAELPWWSSGSAPTCQGRGPGFDPSLGN